MLSSLEIVRGLVKSNADCWILHHSGVVCLVDKKLASMPVGSIYNYLIDLTLTLLNMGQGQIQHLNRIRGH